MTELIRALRYPWRSDGWLGQMLPLTLWQFVPIVGQIILVGYGQAVARTVYCQQTVYRQQTAYRQQTVYHQQSSLPRLQLGRSLADGLRLTAIGLVYCFPAILMLLLTLSTSTPEPEASGGVPAFIYPVIIIVYTRISREIAKRREALKSMLSFINPIVSVGFGIFLVLRLRDVFVMLRGGLQFSELQLDGTSLMMVLMALLLLAIILVALLVSGVRFAVSGSSLLRPQATLQLMITNRSLTVRFILAVWLLSAGTLIATVVGAVFLLLPGFLLLVAGSLSVWFLAAQYALRIGCGVPEYG